MYEKQAQSKQSRELNKTLGVYLRTDELFEQVNRKHFKKQYAGKPTEKYLKLTEKIRIAEFTPFGITLTSHT